MNFIVYINISRISQILLRTNKIYLLHKTYHDNISTYMRLLIILLL